MLSEELPDNDCPPVRVKLLSERLVAFRDSKGRFGLIDEFCPHRGVSLWFGRNEECGLRCPYHGWKYDVDGNCLDVPSEPEESGFRAKIKLKSYPLIERGGILWTYMGPADRQPPLPEWEFITVPANQTYSSKRCQESNWLQAMEGGIDSSRRLLPAPRQSLNSESAVSRARAATTTISRIRSPSSKWSIIRRGFTSARGARPRGRPLLLAHHTLGDALLHPGAAARRPSHPRPFLDSHRR